MTTTPPTPAPERDFPYVLTGPEIELAEVMRLAHMPSFSLSIEHRDQTFVVRLTDTVAGRFLEGHGSTFELAWRALGHSELCGLELRDRIAARGQRVRGHLSVVEARP